VIFRPTLLPDPAARAHGVEAQPWVWAQRWRDVLFLHWRADAAGLRRRLPAALEVETFGGSAWLSLVVFRLRVRPCGLPFLPGLGRLVEANLRTYVSCRGRPGICFLSVHADDRWAVRLARLFTPIPYAWGRLRYGVRGPRCRFALPPAFQATATVAPEAEEKEAKDGGLDAWLLERYRLYAAAARGLWQAEVSHPRWRFRDATATVAADAAAFAPSAAPDRAHFSTGLDALFGAFRS
jgi:uncharacterized protein YqjF (DUF2071 family)